jgi:hypothetical protein
LEKPNKKMKVTEKEDSKKQDSSKDKTKETTEAGKSDPAKETKEIKDPDTLTFEGKKQIKR